uniref:Uncharacterized protein n=1 Tax=viral metagenome TaxID=1070528 RepID=A0A6C0BPJ2_9ZZZZ
MFSDVTTTLKSPSIGQYRHWTFLKEISRKHHFEKKNFQTQIWFSKKKFLNFFFGLIKFFFVQNFGVWKNFSF